LDIPDANGVAPAQIYLQYGPRVTAAVQKWKRRRAGETAPFEAKVCESCGKDGPTLWCSRCKAARYCTKTCQRDHWRTHKLVCRPFDASTTVTVRPVYNEFDTLIPTSDLIRQRTGVPVQVSPDAPRPSTHAPRLHPDEAKAMIVKVQIPYFPHAPLSSPLLQSKLLLYNKSRSFACSVHWANDPEPYDRIIRVVRAQGVGGAKAYFPAELVNKDKLVIKIGEVLAEQPF